jgi:hypothetical protein
LLLPNALHVALVSAPASAPAASPGIHRSWRTGKFRERTCAQRIEIMAGDGSFGRFGCRDGSGDKHAMAG